MKNFESKRILESELSEDESIVEDGGKEPDQAEDERLKNMSDAAEEGGAVIYQPGDLEKLQQKKEEEKEKRLEILEKIMKSSGKIVGATAKELKELKARQEACWQKKKKEIKEQTAEGNEILLSPEESKRWKKEAEAEAQKKSMVVEKPITWEEKKRQIESPITPGMKVNISMEDLARYEKEFFLDVSDEGELLRLLHKINSIEGSQKTYTQEELVNIVKKVLKNEAPIEIVTSKMGLRSAVEKILIQKAEEKKNHPVKSFFNKIVNF